MKITKKWLEKQDFNEEILSWFLKQKETYSTNVIKALRAENEFVMANWLFVRLMSYSQYVDYAVYSIEQVIGIYEKKHPNDKRPRKAIEAVKRCIDNPSKENKDNARVAGSYYTYIAGGNAEEVWNAVSYAVTAAVRRIAPAACLAAQEAYKIGEQATREKIFDYGIKLLEGKA